ncbi:MAG: hypothetical protein GX321_03190 [Clostridiales bacterium]|nr:hypothetical protein [Clostridiales bacterium]
MKKIIKKKRIYKKWTIPCIIILIIGFILGGILYSYYSAPQRIIKKYLKNRFTYSYNSIDNNMSERKNILSEEYIIITEDNGIIDNFLIEVNKNHITSRLGDYDIKSISKTDQNYYFIVKATSYIQDVTNNIMKNEMVGLFIVQRYNLWRCFITNIEPIPIEDMDHENHNH